tara:strand:+ start:255 stop:656 length:402 start_codon:yes stop_codon:yes gene_type:complete
MTSKLIVDNIAGRTTAGSIAVVAEGNSTTTNLQQGLAKAWAGGDSDGTTIRDSFNMASRTDEGTGDFDYTVTNAFAAQIDDGACAGMAFGGPTVIRGGSAETTTTVIDIKCNNMNADDLEDRTHGFMIFGDLA